MKLIAAAGVALALMLGGSGAAQGAQFSSLFPWGSLDSDTSYLTGPDNDPRVFISERGNPEGEASIRLVEDGVLQSQPFLTIGNVDIQTERGLLSFAFAPDYASSGLFYVIYAAKGPDALDPSGNRGDMRVVEYRVSTADPDRADPASARLVIAIPHEWAHHNGGWIGFGPDDDLYITVGDNGERENAQELDTLLGKVLRIDPADPPGTASYTIPSDNPFVETSGARREIWSYGLRNPFRASFAPDGRFIVADVGDATWEEINVGDLKGKNLGWPECEGFCSPPNPAFTDPFFVVNSSGSDYCAIIGGHVVKDPSLTGLTGRYIYADYCRGIVQSIDLDTPGGNNVETDLNTYSNVLSFGQDGLGCSYVLTAGEVFRLVDEDSESAACPIPPRPPVEPTYLSYIPKRAAISRLLVVEAKCSISCAATATATFRVSKNRTRRKPTTFTLTARPENLAPEQRSGIGFTIPTKRVRAMNQAVRKGSRVSARVKVTMTGADSSGGSGSGTIRLFRPFKRP